MYATQLLRALLRQWRVIGVLLLAGALHALANASGDARFLVPEPPADLRRGFGPATVAWEQHRVRLSLLWHGLAWLAHTGLFHRLAKGAGWSRVGGRVLLAEWLWFLPISWLLVDAGSGFGGRLLPGYGMHGIWAPDPASQWVILLVSPIAVACAWGRVDASRVRTEWVFLFAVTRAVFVIAMTSSAVVPFNLMTGHAWPMPLALAFVMAYAGALVGVSTELHRR